MQRDEWGRRGGKRDTSGTAVCMAFHFSVILKPPFYPFLLPYDLAYLLPYPSLPSPSSIQTDKQRRLHFSSPESNGESREREQTEEEEDWMDGFRKEGRGGG